MNLGFGPMVGSTIPGMGMQPRKRSWQARLFDRMMPEQEGMFAVGEDDKKALVKQGLLQLGIGLLQNNQLGAGLGQGLQGGLLAMNQGANDIRNDRYQQAVMGRTMQGMDRNARMEALQGQIMNPDGTVNEAKFREFAVMAPQEAKAFRDAVMPSNVRKNPGQPVYLRDPSGQFEDPYVWDDQAGGYVSADQFLAQPQTAAAPTTGAGPMVMEDALYKAIEQVESGGNPLAVSPAGAIGPMQTMPGTLRDPGFGVAPARDGSIDEQRRVGQDYATAMIGKYGPVGGLAAYNWGPKNWEAALQRSGGDPQRALQLAPKETQDYVPRVMAQMGGAPGAMPPRVGRRPVKTDEGRAAPSGYRWSMDGSGLEPIPGGPADKQNNPVAADLAKGEMGLRKELQDAVKNDRESIAAFQNLEKQSGGGGISDSALIIGYMKTLDPTSVVRESEFATIQNATGLDERVRSYIKRKVNGEKLSEEQRQDIIRSARAFANQAQDRLSSRTREYQGIAEQYGWDTRRATGMPDFRNVTSGDQPAAGGGDVDDILSKYGIR